LTGRFAYAPLGHSCPPVKGKTSRQSLTQPHIRFPKGSLRDVPSLIAPFGEAIPLGHAPCGSLKLRNKGALNNKSKKLTPQPSAGSVLTGRSAYASLGHSCPPVKTKTSEPASIKTRLRSPSGGVCVSCGASGQKIAPFFAVLFKNKIFEKK